MVGVGRRVRIIGSPQTRTGDDDGANDAFQLESGEGAQTSHLQSGLEIVWFEVNLETTISVSLDDMKKILMLATAALALPFLTSCADYATYGYASVGAPISGGYVGGGLAPLQVGFVATTYSQWAYDPYRRAYYDRRVGCFYDHRARRYCTVTPRRYSTPIYPTGYHRGGRLSCPTYLPRHSGHGNSRVVSNRGRYSPVVHGSSRGSTSIHSAGNYDKRSSGSSSNRGNSSRPSGYTNSSPSRGSTSNRGSSTYRPSSSSSSTRKSTYKPSSSSSRYQTVGTTSRNGSSASRSRSTPSVRSQPVVRSQPAVRSQPVRSAPTVRSSSSNRSTPSRSTTPSRSSSPSRSISSRSSSPSRSNTPSRSSSPSRSTSTPSRSSSQARQRTR